MGDSLNGAFVVYADCDDITAKVYGYALTSGKWSLSLEAACLDDMDVSVE